METIGAIGGYYARGGEVDRRPRAAGVSADPGCPAAAAASGPARILDGGDARRLDEPDAAYQATLLLGPLYHLPERRDRVAAVREAARVTTPGGLVAAATISRYAGLYDTLVRGRHLEPEVRRITDTEVVTGVHEPFEQDVGPEVERWLRVPADPLPFGAHGGCEFLVGASAHLTKTLCTFVRRSGSS
jgi:SAM-dependent methyltransferase